MSLGIVIKGPEGLVLAAESRVTILAQTPDGSSLPVFFDSAKKVLAFDRQSHIGVVTYGLAAIGLRTAHSFVPEFGRELPAQKVAKEGGLESDRISVKDFAEKLSDFFMKQWQESAPTDYHGPNMIFIVAGFDPEEAYGRVYLVEIPGNPRPSESQPNLTTDFGITWGGQREFVDRLIRGYDHRLPDVIAKTLDLSSEQKGAMIQALEPLGMQIPFPALALQDCVDLALFVLRTSITGQNLAVALRACGGPIDVATITKSEGLRFVQQKRIVGEQRLS